MMINYLKRIQGKFIPGFINHKIVGNLHKINTNTHNDVIENINVKQESDVSHIGENIDVGNIDYKYCPYLKPLEIKGIKRADRKFDYNSSYSFMNKQKDFTEKFKTSLFTKCLYNGMKIPLPPKRYKISQYVDVRLDMFSPLIITCLICFPFFFTRFMWSVEHA
ncbi:conserved Plasmodium protein, unknown function [Plasmodium sp. gorilla clade G2]|uniref:conserved Plasmodium protein, unknown function n=1 Tax=Plasmodium sp. gorilla clade G2 TaxID=880535 RepID=UPI000D205307|nr:conserved Plasmodium protein, unknown function [Plasmodium sp. gorilla clade G2]SOV17792.1 conserved Plasmodium protein, unknown function [Plasmodium sp. gorilla clade G2]